MNVSRGLNSQAVVGECFPSNPRDAGHYWIEYILYNVGDGESLGVLGTLRFGRERRVETYFVYM